MRIKICGITETEQGCAIAALGATALGFICVEKSPRYIPPPKIAAIIRQLPENIDKIGVFVNTDVDAIAAIAKTTGLTGVQLHGDESPAFCLHLRRHLPKIELIKALRIKNPTDLNQTNNYCQAIDTLLLDAYHPHQRGGTGKTLDWQILQDFQPASPWFLAGGLTPDNILAALSQIHPHGIDLSSGVERSPGHKDLAKVAQLLAKLNPKN
ncbi:MULTISPECIES: phosphoribosylanthranilate isomerase [Spirulina sp. CCY15215]|uniref:phosphoribosylanthranilate isomerase n=1 Tax=Spirulina sp. CCY15215 TaxID=2767591 RepID=UPI0019504088|nr:phosphoribosylanthranilate isomerase [Spirulina major]